MKMHIARDLFKSKTRRLTRRHLLAAPAAFVALIALFAVATMHWHFIAIPFDPARMWVEARYAATRRHYDEAGNHTGSSWREMEPTGWMQANEVRINELVLRTNGFTARNLSIYGRDIYRNGIPVRLVFYNYTEAPAAWLARNALRWNNRADGRSWSQFLSPQNGETFYAEVYYLPNLHRLMSRRHHTIPALSDQEMDALRENASPVWQGTVEQP